MPETAFWDHKKRQILLIALVAGTLLTLALLRPVELQPSPAAGALGASIRRAGPHTATDIFTHTVFLPLVSHRSGHDLSVNPQNRQASLDFFHQVYRASEGISAAWTGSHATCDAGTTAQAFRDTVQLRINYFRAMAGLPGDVQLSDEYNTKAQQAALMMSVNGQLSHSPPSTWQCYSEEGREAAGSSNLYLGVYGPSAITGYMADPGAGNYFVGHRRWILYPQTKSMGTGDIPPSGTHWPSNALWVFDENMWQPRPGTREPYVAWPPPGYVPYQVIFPRWSFAYAQADFSAATVEMSTAGQSIPLTVQPVVNGYGENTLVWEPELSFGSPPLADTSYTVVVRQVGIRGTLDDFSYQVTVFDPGPSLRVPSGTGAGFLGTPPKLP
jgi:uncharacterized protein YkwD